MREYLFGVDVGGTSIKIGKFDQTGELLEKWSIKTNKENHGESILKDITNAIKKNTPLKNVKGIGVGVPGPVTHDIVISCVNLGWQRKNIKQELHALLNDDEIIVRAGNDATLAAAGELYKGVAKGYKTVAMFTLGTGVGGGIILEDELVEGVNGVAGELGHTIVDFEHNYHCNCGKRGCLETVASATGIVKLAKENLEKSTVRSPLRRYQNFSAKKVFDFAKQGDYISKKTIDESMKYLAFAMANITLSINPEMIIIGGGVSHAGDIIIKSVEKYYYDMVKPFISHTSFAIASLGNDAGIYGCCYLVK